MAIQKFIYTFTIIFFTFLLLSACNTPELKDNLTSFPTSKQTSNIVTLLPPTRLLQTITPTPFEPQKEEGDLIELTPQLTSTPNNARQFIIPEIISRCPSNREVSVQELNFVDTHNVLITQPITNQVSGGLWRFSDGSEFPELIPNTMGEQSDWIAFKDIYTEPQKLDHELRWMRLQSQ